MADTPEEAKAEVEETKEPLKITYEIIEREGMSNMGMWFPLLQQMRMRVPETILVGTGDCELLHIVDGHHPPGYDQFVERLKLAASQIGYPVFLRSGMMADKHDYDRTCFIKNKNQFDDHVRRIVESSVMANISGYPFNYRIWAVRKFIYTKEAFTHFNGNLPISKEVRYFIKDGDILTSMPYWPDEAFGNLTDDEKVKLKEVQTISDDDKIELDLMARYIAKHMDGFWSVDFMQDRMGKWWCTDMAAGEFSYGCPEAFKVERNNLVADAFRELRKEDTKGVDVGESEQSIDSQDENNNSES